MSPLPRFLQMPPPDVAIGIDAGRVAGARLAWPGGQAVVSAHAMAPLPAGAVVPSLVQPNLADPAPVAAAVREVVAALGGRPRRAALVLPDPVGKVSLVRFDSVPARTADLTELVRWQMKKTAPFPVEQAVVTYAPGATPPEGGREFIVTLARQDVVAQYEAVCADAGLHAGLVDLASFNVINGVLAGTGAPAGDWLLVHVTPHSVTLAVVREGHLIFFRNRTEDAEGSLADVIHQTAMYYEDRLQGGGFSRVLLSGAALVPGGAEALRRNLEERLGGGVAQVDPRAAAGLTDRISATPELLDALAPLVGVLLRERAGAAA